MKESEKKEALVAWLGVKSSDIELLPSGFSIVRTTNPYRGTQYDLYWGYHKPSELGAFPSRERALEARSVQRREELERENMQSFSTYMKLGKLGVSSKDALKVLEGPEEHKFFLEWYKQDGS